MKVFFLAILLSLASCAEESVKVENSNLPNCEGEQTEHCARDADAGKPADAICKLYRGNVCISPENKPPDWTCHLYRGELCIVPVVSPDQNDFR